MSFRSFRRKDFNERNNEKNKSRADYDLERSRQLERRKIDSISRVVRKDGRNISEVEIQEIVKGLSTNITLGKREKESKRELERLGFLN